MMKSVTLNQVMEWGPCYDQDKIEQWFNGRESVTAQDVVGFQQSTGEITQLDVVWFLLHNEFLTDEQTHELACKFAESFLHLCGDDPRPRAAIEAKRAWLRGEITDGELAAARDAAWDAAGDASRYAAESAARAAARAAAGDAAWAAAMAAARDAAWHAAWDAAWDAAMAAARDAAGDAAGDAAWDAAWHAHIKLIIEAIDANRT